MIIIIVIVFLGSDVTNKFSFIFHLFQKYIQFNSIQWRRVRQMEYLSRAEKIPFLSIFFFDEIEKKLGGRFMSFSIYIHSSCIIMIIWLFFVHQNRLSDCFFLMFWGGVCCFWWSRQTVKVEVEVEKKPKRK